MRYCPSWRHAALLLSLLSSDPNPSTNDLIENPGLIVLSDLSALFDADMDEAKENLPPPSTTEDVAMEGGEGGGGGGGSEGGKGGEGIEKKEETKRELSKDAWQYLSLVSAAKQAASHLGAALIVLEHSPCSLPLPASANSSRSVEMKNALQNLLGHVLTISGKLRVSVLADSRNWKRRV